MDTERIDRLLETACYIIDFLPVTVEREMSGQFFDVENYLLNSKRYLVLKDRFAAVILKVMCYYHVFVWQEEWIDRPSPEWIDHRIDQMTGASEDSEENDSLDTLNLLLPKEDVLLVLHKDSLTMEVYNPPESVQAILERIAFSEGLFWRKSCR